MAMVSPRLLRGLIAPLSPADWLSCHQQLLSSVALLHSWWLPSLARLHCPSCSDGFKLFLVLLLVSAALAEVCFVASTSMAPTLHPGDRAVAEKVSYMFRRPSVGDIVFFRASTTLQNCGINKDVVFIKRVIATLGDFIEGLEESSIERMLGIEGSANFCGSWLRKNDSCKWKVFYRHACTIPLLELGLAVTYHQITWSIYCQIIWLSSSSQALTAMY